MMVDAAVHTSTIVRGLHRFTDPELTRIAAQRGPAAAWLAGFERHGPGVLRLVDGDFAVSLTTDDGRQFAAVDRFAVHPLCYRVDGSALRVAERADALAGIGPTMEPQALFDYLYFHVVPAPRTIFHGVTRLTAGHCIVAGHGPVAVTRWWQPVFVEDARPDFPALRDEFNRLLRASVRDRLDRSEVGCFLSGGTDSSTVAGLVTELTGRPARTYSIGFDAQGYDEMEYARIAARHFRTDHHEYYVTADDVVRSIPALAASYDQPFGNSSVLPAYYCAKRANDDGVTLMLAGDGGDELFGGNTRYAAQRVFEAYARIPEWLRASLIEPLARRQDLAKMRLAQKAASYIEQASTAMPDRMQRHNLLLRLGMTEILTPEFLSRVDPGAPLRQQREVYGDVVARALINRMLAYDWRYTLADNDLPKVIGATAHAGLAVAFPMLDDRMIDFSLRLPPDYKLRRSKLRWFFKEALQGFLPAEIIAKKKHGFGLPFGIWTTRHAPLRELAFDSVLAFAQRGIVRREFVSRLIDEHLPRHPGYYGEMVWILMSAELWLQGRKIPA